MNVYPAIWVVRTAWILCRRPPVSDHPLAQVELAE
jgi:hypothetical protein